MHTSLYRKVGLASAVMMASVFLSRVVGLLREMTIAYMGGVGPEVDAYQIAFILPEILNHVAATGFLSVTFIPLFTRYLLNESEAEAWRIFSIILSVFGSLTLAIVVGSMAFAPHLVALAAPGVDDPQTLAVAVRMTRIILPAQFFFFAGGLLMAVQFAHERFLLPALAPLIYNVGIILGGILLAPWIGIEGFAWGVLAGAVTGNFLLQVTGARRVGMQFLFAWQWSHPDVKEYLRLTLPLMLGLTMTFSTEFLFRFFGSYLPAGSIAILNFSLRVMLILVGIFGQAVGTASFPYLARLAAANHLDDLNALLNRTLRYLALVMPLAALLGVLSPEVVNILFQRGRFDSAAARATADVLVWFLAGAVAFAAYTVIVRGYYATRNTLFPAIYGSLAVLISIPLYPLGMAWMGVEGVALAVSVSGILQAGLLFAFWSRRSGNRGQKEVFRFYLKIGAVSAGLAAVLAPVREAAIGWVDPLSFSGSLVVAAVVGLVFIGLMVAVGYGLKIVEIQHASAYLWEKLRSKS